MSSKKKLEEVLAAFDESITGENVEYQIKLFRQFLEREPYAIGSGVDCLLFEKLLARMPTVFAAFVALIETEPNHPTFWQTIKEMITRHLIENDEVDDGTTKEVMRYLQKRRPKDYKKMADAMSRQYAKVAGLPGFPNIHE